MARTFHTPWEQLRETMSAVEYTDHLVEYSIAPWDELRADLRAGLICSLLANIYRSKDQKPFKASDFMPYLQPALAADDFETVQKFFEGM